MKLKPPATPIINIDPYFSIWIEKTNFKRTNHWTGAQNTVLGTAVIDGEPWYFMGYTPLCSLTGYLPSDTKVLSLEQTQVDAFSTIVTFVNESIRLTVHFTSPVLPDSLYYASRPVAYCKVSWEALDGQDHTVSVRFTATEELVLNRKGDKLVTDDLVALKGAAGIRMGALKQEPLGKYGDDLRIDWGYLYLGAAGQAQVGHLQLADMYAIYAEKALDKDALFFFAYDDLESIQYFGENLKAYWKNGGKTIEQAIEEALAEYDSLLARCDRFSQDLQKKATEVGSEKYADMLLLSLRQIMAAHKLVVDNKGNNLYISKECFSNGCAATVDITYPSAPLFLLYNPELLKAMIRPVMDYAASEEWTYDFAPHDVGKYPILNGQAYGASRVPVAEGQTTIDVFRYTRVETELYGVDYGKEAHFLYAKQMPVEECGNMIILFAELCRIEGNTEFVNPHLDTVAQWCKYLIDFGEDPANQLCTDDFAGHLAHNVNLSIKAIMGIAGYSKILSMLGKDAEAASYMEIAKKYAASLIVRAANPDGSFRLAYDWENSFSLKYNAVWDKLWGTKLFPDHFYQGEIARYKKELLPYGVPLDSRDKLTKSDWLLWVASLADNKEDFNLLVDSLWTAYNTSRSYVPMTDIYYCDTAHLAPPNFLHRSVQGGLFIKLMME
ncbi:MAG: DUF4965 domain-containing protein [Oscillospiraceae bacterium]|nr:DUF4965 domain-containing protein [Oscillospiraceae bacterium]